MVLKRNLAAFLVVGALVSGCGGDGGGSSDPGTATTGSVERSSPGPEGGPEPSEVGALVGTLGDPLSGYTRLSVGDESVLHDAIEAEVRACMNDRGFRYEPALPPEASVGDLTERAMTARQLDPDDLTGYGFSVLNESMVPRSLNSGLLEPGETPSDPRDANAWTYELSDTERAEWSAALLGHADPLNPSGDVVSVQIGENRLMWDPNSCIALGESAIYGDLEEWRVANGMVADVLRSEANAKLVADPEVSSGVSAWSTCMRTHGFEFASLDEPIRLLASTFPPGTPAAESAEMEATMAPADATCFQEAGLADTLLAAQEAIEAEVLAANEGVLVRYVELRDAALARVR